MKALSGLYVEEAMLEVSHLLHVKDEVPTQNTVLHLLGFFTVLQLDEGRGLQIVPKFALSFTYINLE